MLQIVDNSTCNDYCEYGCGQATEKTFESWSQLKTKIYDFNFMCVEDPNNWTIDFTITDLNADLKSTVNFYHEFDGYTAWRKIINKIQTFIDKQSSINV